MYIYNIYVRMFIYLQHIIYIFKNVTLYIKIKNIRILYTKCYFVLSWCYHSMVLFRPT